MMTVGGGPIRVRKAMATELRGLSWAIIASKHRSLRQAAKALNVRQSTPSRAVSDLESQWVLFEQWRHASNSRKTEIAGRSAKRRQ